MSVATQTRSPEHLRGLVDMGSNGIRFSISDLQPPTQRVMPTVYQHRVGISLYDAQYSASGERIPIDEKTISDVVSAFKRFQRTCRDFGVPDGKVNVLATEATRTAINSEEFRRRIQEAVGWEVEMLAKEEEGRVGAMGVASSLPEVSGLVMDLGGGSTQLSWLVRKGNQVLMPEAGAVSMPYGAAAMSRRLVDAEKGGSLGVKRLEEEIDGAVRSAYKALKIPEEMENVAEEQGGLTLYLSGGGFRGWGYVLMSQHRISPYPVPVINGFKVSRKEFLSTDQVKVAAKESLEDGAEKDLFRISDRRASQVPAVSFLINILAEALPLIKEVRFCQGGVREGYLFSSLPPEIKSEFPLVVATQPVAPQSSALLLKLLASTLPDGSTKDAHDGYKSVFTSELLEAFTNLIYYHGSHSKDLQAMSALRSTTSGILAGVHGVLHESRALIALLLCARWGGGIPPSDESFKRNLEQLVESPWTLWWINYVGAVASLIASIYPAGVMPDGKERLKLNAKWGIDEKQRSVLQLTAKVEGDVDGEVLGMELRHIEKVGKRKRWIGGKEGIGHRVNVEVGRAGT